MKNFIFKKYFSTRLTNLPKKMRFISINRDDKSLFLDVGNLPVNLSNKFLKNLEFENERLVKIEAFGLNRGDLLQVKIKKI